jgi:hypothetical protein
MNVDNHDGPLELADYLTAGTMLRLAQQFARFTEEGHPHEPSAAQWHALEWLAEQMARQAVGIADPVYHLSSLDPGVGKTQTLVAFIRTLLGDPRFDHVGIIVFANRLEELYAFPTEDTPEGESGLRLLRRRSPGRQGRRQVRRPDPR